MHPEDDEAITGRIEEMKRENLLRYLREATRHDPSEVLGIGDAGERLGLPYGEAIRLADELRESGMLRRVGRLNAPNGPGVRLTPLALRAS